MIQSVYPWTKRAFKKLRKENSKKFKNLFTKFQDLIKELMVDFDDLEFRLSHCVNLQPLLNELMRLCPVNNCCRKYLRETVKPIHSIMNFCLPEEMISKQLKIIKEVYKNGL